MAIEFINGLPKVMREGISRNPFAGGEGETAFRQYTPLDGWAPLYEVEGQISPWRDPTYQEFVNENQWNLTNLGFVDPNLDDRHLEGLAQNLQRLNVPDWAQALEGLGVPKGQWERIGQHAQGYNDQLSRIFASNAGGLENFIMPAVGAALTGGIAGLGGFGTAATAAAPATVGGFTATAPVVGATAGAVGGGLSGIQNSDKLSDVIEGAVGGAVTGGLVGGAKDFLFPNGIMPDVATTPQNPFDINALPATLGELAEIQMPITEPSAPPPAIDWNTATAQAPSATMIDAPTPPSIADAAAVLEAPAAAPSMPPAIVDAPAIAQMQASVPPPFIEEPVPRVMEPEAAQEPFLQQPLPTVPSWEGPVTQEIAPSPLPTLSDLPLAEDLPAEAVPFLQQPLQSLEQPYSPPVEDAVAPTINEPLPAVGVPPSPITPVETPAVQEATVPSWEGPLPTPEPLPLPTDIPEPEGASGGPTFEGMVDKAKEQLGAVPGKLAEKILSSALAAGGGLLGAEAVKSIVGDGGTQQAEVPAPAMSEQQTSNEERELLRSLNDQFQSDKKRRDMLDPLLIDELGFEPILDASGAVTGYRRKPLSPEDQRRRDIETRFMDMSLAELEDFSATRGTRSEIDRALLNRTNKALKGELEIDPSLTRELGDQRLNLEDTLRKNLGPGYATSTPGIQAMAEYDKRKAETLYGAARDQITTNEGLSRAREAGSFGRATDSGNIGASDKFRGSRINDIFTATTLNQPSYAQGGAIAGGLNSSLSRMQTGRLGAGQLSLGSEQLNAMLRAGMMQGMGQFAGQALFSPIFGSGKPSLAGRAINAIFG